MPRLVRVVGIDQYMTARYGVRAGSPVAGAVTSSLVSTPRAPVRASSHRTDARSRSPRPLSTPLGPTSRFSV